MPGALSQPLEPVTLSGQHVRLVPLQREHTEALEAAVLDGELWKIWYTSVPAPEEMAAEIDRRLELWAAGQMLPFAVVQVQSGEVVGTTGYMNINAGSRRVEIGTTWYARRVQRTGLNTEAKLLLLRYAFEQLQCIAVEIRVHALNRDSRRAVERLGAKLDGILRNHAIAKNGTLRDTCVYSVLPAEWPTVEAHLERLLEWPLEWPLERGR